MILRKFLASSALGAALLFSVPAAAETVRVGATVTDPQGGEVGTITAVDGQFVTLRTDRHEARLPVNSFTATDTALLFALTRDQLNSQVEQALAQAQQAAQQAVAVGAVVHDSAGAVIGPVEAVDAEAVTVKFGEQQVRFPRAAVAPAQNGLVVGLTVAQLQAQLGAAPAEGN